ncbi:hypothetical protein AVEN_137903-1 [Araneus ventricosus]|uniref:RNase H type-1 domain-containing protein n=1 Tax=Araneus ventricosus TaxID=182803 RepID=A0A4Y2IYN9_ARAVE|nr:hypothetical protein AVEN_137903-1 [Araneus ventricosus]
MARIALTTWGLKQEHRRILYSTVAERMILHGAAAWEQNITSRQKKLLEEIQTIQRKFLLFIFGAYRTTLTAAMQSITGILPLYLRAEQEAVYVRVARLRRREYFQGEEFILEDFEAKDPFLRQHPAKFYLDNGINFSPHNTDSKGFNIYTDGSKMEGNAGSAFVTLHDNTQLHE